MRCYRHKNAWRVVFVLMLTIVALFCMYRAQNDRTMKQIYTVRSLPPSEQLLPVNNYGKSKAQCVLPTLDIKDPVMMKFYKKMKPVDCHAHHNDLAYVENGTLRFSKTLSPETKCDMYPLIRGPGDYKISFGAPVENVKDRTPLISDFFKIKCTENKKDIYENIHSGVHSNTTLKNRMQSRQLPANGLQLSVVMLGFDSMSRMSWLRRMPKTRDYFVNELGAIELEGYGIMGDGTPAALFPMLSGKHEQELPEARRSHRGAKTIDGFPWIWKDFQKNGYITSWGEPQTGIATFNYRLLGFEHAPTDFFLRPFYLAVEPTFKKYKAGCHGSLRLQQVWFNLVRQICTMYKNNPKFLFHFYDTLSHEDNNHITMADDDLLSLLHFMQEGGYLENTLFVMFADHGARFSNVRATLSGKLEERTPYFALRFPKWFHTKHPDLVHNVRTNVRRLTTPMDIHETLKDILKFDGIGVGNVAHRGISLFKEIPKERTCAQADIAPHWCTCMSWKNVSVQDSNVKQAAQAAVDFFNGLTQEYRDYCALLSVKQITHAYSSQTSESVLKFKETKGDRGLEPIMSAGTKDEKLIYQLTLVVAPSDGQFEVTLQHDVSSNIFTLDPRAISRLNKYGSAPNCVLHKNRDIRQYCYCKGQV